MIPLKAVFGPVLLLVQLTFAADAPDPPPDTLSRNPTEADSSSVTSSAADSLKSDTIGVDSIPAAKKTGQTAETSPVSVLPELEIISSRYVKFFDHAIAFNGEELAFTGSFIVLGKAVYGHFDFLTLGDSATVLNITTTEDRSYRSDKGGNPKTITRGIGPATGSRLVKASFHETRLEPEGCLCNSR
jgi:hypothetical protein